MFHQIIEKYLKISLVSSSPYFLQNNTCQKLSLNRPSILTPFILYHFILFLPLLSLSFRLPLLCISLWHYAISSLRVRFLLRCCAISTETQARPFIGGSSSHVPALSLLRYCSLSLSLSLSLRCLGAWGLVQRGIGLWMGLIQKGMGFSFYPHLQLDSFNFWIWCVLKSLRFEDLEPSLFVSYEFVDVSLYGFLRLSFICLL
jgi:hypothetical protein